MGFPDREQNVSRKVTARRPVTEPGDLLLRERLCRNHTRISTAKTLTSLALKIRDFLKPGYLIHVAMLCLFQYMISCTLALCTDKKSILILSFI
jgi:hypothetical protein